jgi:type II secretion system protein H
VAHDAAVAFSVAPLNAARTAQRAVPTRPGDARNGFTLIEMMVVVILIGIMAAAIIPAMKGTYEDALLRSTGREVVNACGLASSRAVSFNQPYRLRIDLRTGKYSVEKRVRQDGEEQFVPLRDVPGGEGELDTRIALEVRRPDENPDTAAASTPSGSADNSSGAGQEIISFYPDGTADEAMFLLHDRSGFRLALRINPITARVQATELARE